MRKLGKFGMLFLVAVLAVGGIVAANAQFSEEETSAITFTSGTVDLQLAKDADGPWYNSLSFSTPDDWAPGDTYSLYVYTKNAGRSGLKSLFVTGDRLTGDTGLGYQIYISDVAYTDRDPDNPGELNFWVHPAGGTYYDTVFGNQAAKLWLSELAAGKIDGKKMNFCWGGTTADPYLHGDYLPANGGMRQGFYIEFTFDENAGNEWQDKACSFDLIFRGTDEPGTFVWFP